jgi:hypothetical protein
MYWRWMILPLCLGIVQTTSAAWLGVCKNSPSDSPARILTEYISPQNIRTVLLINSEPMSDCDAIELPISAEKIISGKFVSPNLEAALETGFALSGTIVDKQYRVNAVVAREDRASAPAPAPTPLARTPRTTPIKTHSSTPSRSFWVWQAQEWIQSPEALLNKIIANNAGTLFLNIPVDLKERSVLNAGELKDFVKAATQRGVKVWAVVGDPAAVLEDQRGVYTRYPEAYLNYNKSVPPSSQLAGIQFDIEPYLNEGYALDPQAWYAAYLDTLRQIKQISALPIDVALPYWWADEKISGRLLMDQLADKVDSVTVMNYRTRFDQLKRNAQPFLEWGIRNHHSVKIALESGPIPDEILHHYVPDTKGKLALIKVGSNLLLLEFDQALSFPASFTHVHSFHYSSESTIFGNETTFSGRRDELLKMLPELETLWGHWTSFSGIALHEFEL